MYPVACICTMPSFDLVPRSVTWTVYVDLTFHRASAYKSDCMEITNVYDCYIVYTFHYNDTSFEVNGFQVSIREVYKTTCSNSWTKSFS